MEGWLDAHWHWVMFVTVLGLGLSGLNLLHKLGKQLEAIFTIIQNQIDPDDLG